MKMGIKVVCVILPRNLGNTLHLLEEPSICYGEVSGFVRGFSQSERAAQNANQSLYQHSYTIG